jgi:hypothetical protein
MFIAITYSNYHIFTLHLKLTIVSFEKFKGLTINLNDNYSVTKTLYNVYPKTKY